MPAFYNDNDPRTCAWLRELVAAGLITEGTVDERPIQEIQAADLAGYDRCHFFGGIGGWEYALALAGWPADRPVWTGSCPCQPFSTAGKGKGEADERHLWPAFFSLIREYRPDCIFGEQVASRDGYRWLDGVRTDLETEGYSLGAADLPAACVGAPHIRQRLFWVASRFQSPDAECDGQSQHKRRTWAGGQPDAANGFASGHSSDAGRAERRGSSGQRPDGEGSAERIEEANLPGQRGGGGDFWDAFDIIHYRDGKSRRVEPGTFPLAHGVPARLVKLRGYGNAIVPQAAAKFIRAFLDVTGSPATV